MTHWGGVPTGESYDDKYYIGPKDDKPWTKDLNFKQRCQMEWYVCGGGKGSDLFFLDV